MAKCILVVDDEPVPDVAGEHPDQWHYQYMLGNAAVALGEVAQATICLERAIQLSPDNPEVLNALGVAYRKQGRVTEAIGLYERALVERPNDPKTLSNLGTAQTLVGLHRKGNDALHRAAAYGGAEALSNWLLSLHYSTQDDTLLHGAARDYQRRFGTAVPRPAPYHHDRIRVGIVSGDFREHPLGMFMRPLAEYLDHERFEVHGYSTNPLRDNVTAWYEEQLGTSLQHECHLECAIRFDEIDVLIDCSGHTAGNVLPLFAKRPAVCQLTWGGYPDTTGLDCFTQPWTASSVMNSGSLAYSCCAASMLLPVKSISQLIG